MATSSGHYNPAMDADALFRFVFVFYTTTVGVVLLLAPWTPGWDPMIAQLPSPMPRLLTLPILRGALSGFGLVHLVWTAHDVTTLLRAPD